MFSARSALWTGVCSKQSRRYAIRPDAAGASRDACLRIGGYTTVSPNPNTGWKVESVEDLAELLFPRLGSSCPAITMNTKSDHGGSMHGNQGNRRIQTRPRLRGLRN